MANNTDITDETLDTLEGEFKSNDDNSETNISIDDGIVVNSTQQEIIKELAKIDLELDTLGKQTVSTDEFYDKLDDILTDEEKYLQEENPKEYLKLIDTKKQEFIQSNSNQAKIDSLIEQKKELQLKNAIEIGVREVTGIYKDYNHLEMQTFWNKKLSKDEQDEMLKDAKSTTELFRRTHEKYLEKSGKKVDIKTTTIPKTPDLTKVVKQSIKTNQITEIDSEEEKYKRALGV